VAEIDVLDYMACRKIWSYIELPRSKVHKTTVTLLLQHLRHDSIMQTAATSLLAYQCYAGLYG